MPFLFCLRCSRHDAENEREGKGQEWSRIYDPHHPWLLISNQPNKYVAIVEPQALRV